MKNQKNFITFLFLIILICGSIFVSIYANKQNYNNKIELFYTKYIYLDDITISKNSKLYNLGDLLLVPKLYGFSEWVNKKEHQLYRETIDAYPNSILQYYEKLRKTPNEDIPNYETIQHSVDTYIDSNITKNDKLRNILEFIQNENVLCIHLRTGDMGNIQPEFYEVIKKMGQKYDYVVIICGIHYSDKEITNTFLDDINSLFDISNNNNILISIEDPDIHMAMFRKCKNLLVHRGGFSVLACIVFTGDNLYVVPKIFTAHSVIKRPEINMILVE